MTIDELDKLAAIHIMGWPDGGWKSPGPPGEFNWQPTRSIEQAWECLEKMSMVSNIVRPVSLVFWKCWLMPSQDSFTHVYAEAKTAPEAIVRACLKAVGVDLE